MAPGNVESGGRREFPPLIREAALPRTLRGRGPVRCLMNKPEVAEALCAYRDCVARYDRAFRIKAADNSDVAWSKVDAAL